MIVMNHLDAGYGGGRPVLKGVCVGWEAGNIYGLLGANGSGKTTLMKTLSGALFPVSGSIDAAGYDPSARSREFLAATVYMPDEIKFPSLSAKAFERIYSSFRPRFSHEDFRSYLDGLNFTADVRLDRLSTGNRKKFFIAFAMACNPSLLLMDEPTNGLDIESKKEFRRLLASFDTEGRVIVVSTHQVADLNNLLSAVTVLRDGGVALNATYDAIAERLCFGGAAVGEALYADGLKSITVNDGGDYTDVDVESLYHAIHESERMRRFIAENFAGKEGVC